ncbi:GTPase Era [Culicoidibacter larvae]|uniref:GTPase Era n=1 Tax=Culicoidibacter larvae TaxID=2579976 RepID=A0A5R8Q9D5_9FIRM|nr:GTPase Era [Culicoidibacter larvae]TLG72033.1 GTPase Era [Culicoidibacter larvae]
MTYKSGFVAIVGRPNVGKSTLLNDLIGYKLAITSDTAQTTRNMIRGIAHYDDAQIIFVDTPGIHKPKHKLGDYMNDSAYVALEGVDVILMLINGEESFGKGDEFVLERLKQLGTPIIAVLNKIDKFSKSKMIERLVELEAMGAFSEIIPIAAKTGDNVTELLTVIKQYLPEGPALYPEEQLTDVSRQFVAREYVREKVIYHTKEEVPHSVAVVIDAWEETEESIHIIASVIVERKSQKGILIGKQGGLIKKVRQQAERDMRRMFDKPTTLELWVKVEKDWRNKDRYLHEFGYNTDDFEL